MSREWTNIEELFACKSWIEIREKKIQKKSTERTNIDKKEIAQKTYYQESKKLNSIKNPHK